MAIAALVTPDRDMNGHRLLPLIDGLVRPLAFVALFRSVRLVSKVVKEGGGESREAGVNAVKKNEKKKHKKSEKRYQSTRYQEKNEKAMKTTKTKQAQCIYISHACRAYRAPASLA